jgi:rhodanese-related sulfurtransferase
MRNGTNLLLLKLKKGGKMRKLFSLVAALVFVLCGMATVSACDDVNATAAYIMLEEDDDTYILDVRTPCEWWWVGHPVDGDGETVLEGKVIHIPWKLWGFDTKTKEYGMEYNKFFDEEVVRQFYPGDTIILVCKKGFRADDACEELENPTHPAFKRLAELDLYYVYRMLGGFEGDGGWKDSGLPYKGGKEGIWTPQQTGRSLK